MNNTILLVGRSHESWCADGWLAASFQQLGWAVSGFDARDEAMQFGMAAMQERLLARVRQEPWALVLITRGGLLEPECVRILGNYSHTHFRYIDVLPRTVLPVAAACHTVSASDPESAALLAGRCIPEGCYPEVHFPGTQHSEWAAELAIAGRAYANRVRVVAALRRAGLVVATFGDANWPPPNCPRKITGADFRDMVASADIQLATNLHDHIRGWTSNRLFMLMACEGFVLVNHFPGIEEWFGQERELIWSSEQEVVPVARYWLERPKARAAIAVRGRQLVLERFTLRHTARAILREVGL